MRAPTARLSGILTTLCERLADDLKRKGYVSRTISIKLRYDDFQIVSRNVTLPQPVADAAAILQAARECLKRVPLQRKLRLLGVRASTLEPPGAAGARGGMPVQATDSPAASPCKMALLLPSLKQGLNFMWFKNLQIYRLPAPWAYTPNNWKRRWRPVRSPGQQQ
jgi:hypothetical protein